MFHTIVGLLLAWLVPASLQEAANTVLLPLAGIFIGLSFAWAGNAMALLQTEELEDLTRQHKGGFEEYVHVFQLAILVLLVTLVWWGLGGLGVFERPCLWDCGRVPYFLVEAGLYTLSAVALRECWHVVLGAQWMLLAQNYIRRVRSSQSDDQAS